MNQPENTSPKGVESDIQFKNKNMKVKDLLNEALSNGTQESQLQFLLNNCTHSQLMEIIKILLKSHDCLPDVLSIYFQHANDASVLECTDQENLESDFKKWALIAFN